MLTEDKLLCGWRVRSELPLPNLPRWTGEERPVDVNIRLGKVVERAGGRNLISTPFSMEPGGICRLEIRNVALYQIDAAGRELIVEPILPPSAPDVRLFILSTMLGVLCFRRGRFPLHASCVRVGHKAVAFTGESGVGKSTMAAALIRQGCPLVADDVTVIDPSASGGVQVYPTAPLLKLDHTVGQRLGYDEERDERPVRALRKRHIPIAEEFADAPLPLAAIYHLSTVHDVRHEYCKPVQGTQRITLLLRMMFRRRLAIRAEMGLRPQTLAAAGRIAGAVPEHYHLHRRHDLEALPDLAASIARRHLESP